KLKPEPEAEGKEKFPESRAEKPERVYPEPPPASTLSPPTSNTTVTNTSDLNDSREINFEYLKHVVLKFMSCREAEAFQLIRAVSVLLNFSREEEDMLKQTLEYKMSWFGSKPSPKGAIRPSISGSSTNWS
ncbi:golgin subfamily A member 1-like, partial [Notothenia coriiceps]|uniref:Golgin subfamily A member 1 n=1 Tax=Notothenia coriiceps TaxID=8208 RepID=A0A6I9NVZ8_9TELE